MARQTTYKDLMKMNLGKSTASFFEFDSVNFFLLEDAICNVYFLLVMCFTTHYGMGFGNVLRGKHIRLG